MKHAWLLLALIGCGDEGGEPQLGDITLNYGKDMPKLDVGAAIQDTTDPTKMLIQIGSDAVDCGTNLDEFDFNGPKATFVYFSVPVAVAAYPSQTVSVEKATSNHIGINSTSGMVSITGVDGRITGTVTFSTTDDTVGLISVAGSFDILRCF